MILAHYSKEPLTKLKAITPGPRLDGMKPNGLWVSDDSAEWGWPDWAAAEDFGLDRMKFRTEIKLGFSANILHIDTLEKLDAFHNEYARPLYPGATHRSEVIDWERLANKHDGIIISPYQYERRLGGPIWYYTWDCASGCVWNKGVIELGESEPFDIVAYAAQREAA